MEELFIRAASAAVLLIEAAAVLVVTFVAFPHRDEEIPGAPWLGEAMTKAADALPTIADGDLDRTDEQGAPVRSTQATDVDPKHV